MKTNQKYEAKSLINELAEILEQLDKTDLPFTILEIYIFGSILHEQKYINDLDLLIVYEDKADSRYIKRMLYQLLFKDEQKFNILCTKKDMIKNGYIFIDSSIKSMKINSFLIWDNNEKDIINNFESINAAEKLQYVIRELNDFLEDIQYLMREMEFQKEISHFIPDINDTYWQIIEKLQKAKKVLKKLKTNYIRRRKNFN